MINPDDEFDDDFDDFGQDFDQQLLAINAETIEPANGKQHQLPPDARRKIENILEQRRLRAEIGDPNLDQSSRPTDRDFSTVVTPPVPCPGTAHRVPSVRPSLPSPGCCP